MSSQLTKREWFAVRGLTQAEHWPVVRDYLARRLQEAYGLAVTSANPHACGQAFELQNLLRMFEESANAYEVVREHSNEIPGALRGV